MSTQIRKRIEAIETKMRFAGCQTCREWKALEVVSVTDDSGTVPPSECPDCGRDARKVVLITERTDGPQ